MARFFFIQTEDPPLFPADMVTSTIKIRNCIPQAEDQELIMLTKRQTYKKQTQGKFNYNFQMKQVTIMTTRDYFGMKKTTTRRPTLLQAHWYRHRYEETAIH